MERPRRDKLGDHLTQLRSSAMADPVFAEALAEASAFLVQRSPAYRLDLPNLVARTEYHSRLVLSTLILRFFRKRGAPPGFRRFFYILPKESPLLWQKTHLFSIAF